MIRTVNPLPMAVEEIDRDWLTAALRTRAPDVTVSGFDIVDVNRGTSTKVRIRLDEPPATIRPGFSVTAEVMTGRVEAAPAIPIQALVVRDVPKQDKKAPTTGRSETEEGVYFIKDGKVGFQKVETGLSGELMIEVKTGPKVGDEIITGPFKVLRQIKEGDRVLVDREGDKKGKKDAAKGA